MKRMSQRLQEYRKNPSFSLEAIGVILDNISIFEFIHVIYNIIEECSHVDETQEWKTQKCRLGQIPSCSCNSPFIQKKEESSAIGPWLMGFFLFVIVGSTLFQILNSTQSSTDDILIWSNQLIFSLTYAYHSSARSKQ